MLKKSMFIDISLTLKHILSIFHDHIHRPGRMCNSFRMVAVSEERINYTGWGGGQTTKFLQQLFITSHIWTVSMKLFHRSACSENLS